MSHNEKTREKTRAICLLKIFCCEKKQLDLTKPILREYSTHWVLLPFRFYFEKIGISRPLKVWSSWSVVAAPSLPRSWKHCDSHEVFDFFFVVPCFVRSWTLKYSTIIWRSFGIMMRNNETLTCMGGMVVVKRRGTRVPQARTRTSPRVSSRSNFAMSFSYHHH